MSTASLTMPALPWPNGMTPRRYAAAAPSRRTPPAGALALPARRLRAIAAFMAQSLLAAAVIWGLLAWPGFLADPTPMRAGSVAASR